MTGFKSICWLLVTVHRFLLWWSFVCLKWEISLTLPQFGTVSPSNVTQFISIFTQVLDQATYSARTQCQLNNCTSTCQNSCFVHQTPWWNCLVECKWFAPGYFLVLLTSILIQVAEWRSWYLLSLPLVPVPSLIVKIIDQAGLCHALMSIFLGMSCRICLICSIIIIQGLSTNSFKCTVTLLNIKLSIIMEI